jgi:hypothetical protein
MVTITVDLYTTFLLDAFPPESNFQFDFGRLEIKKPETVPVGKEVAKTILG